MAEYKKTSPYVNTQQVSFYLDYWSYKNIPPNDNDSLIVLDSKYKERPDLLSYDLYGTTRYWWIFIKRNMNVLQDPIYDFQPGIEIYVPTSEYLNSILG